MTVSVVQIGNSRGIRLPKKILSELNIQDEVEMIIQKNELVIKSVEKNPGRDGTRLLPKCPKPNRINCYCRKILTAGLLNGFGDGTILYLSG